MVNMESPGSAPGPVKTVTCLRYSQEQLYAVVAGVEHYKEFVPWCQRSDIVDKKPPGFVEAELEVGFKMFVERYVPILSYPGMEATGRTLETRVTAQFSRTGPQL